jgi:aminoglycoside phosphotransferase (APT) family kinase protein
VLDRIRAWAATDDVELLDAPPGGGYSNELIYVAIAGEPKVIRLAPSGPPLFPTYDLAMQVAVQEVAGAAGVPVPTPLSAELDPSVLGRPFLVMPRIDGRHPGEAPMLTPWILELGADRQRRFHDEFLGALAAIHRVPAPADLRPWSDELDWWESYASWACEDRVDPSALVELFARCRAAVPATFPASVLLWGDVRMGNVVVADDLSVAAVLDWEMASAGPPECDLAWLIALHGLTLSFVGDDAPGFHGRDAVVAAHEAALGRPMEAMPWHEAFALCRAAVAQYRVDVVKSVAKHRMPPDPAQHLLVQKAAEAVDALG